MTVTNITFSFAKEIQESSIEWLQETYIPLLLACPLIFQVEFFKIITDSDVDECFALQIRFKQHADFEQFNAKYEHDFDSALYMKFLKNFAMFKTTLQKFETKIN